MPNWCYTTVCFYSEKENEKKIDRLFQKLNNIINGNELVGESDFGNKWLGNILINHGISEESIANNIFNIHKYVTQYDCI